MEINWQKNKGQILIESIVSITLVTIGLLGIFSLASRSLGLNKTVADQYAGTYLAAEGIELVKNLIDKNIIDRRPWNFGVSTGDYEMDYDDAGLSLSAGQPIFFDSAVGFYGYGGGAPTVYKRLIKIEQPSEDELKVISSVTWTSRSGDFRADLEDHFFNWR